jgi:flagellar protein export ATPase FliI
MSGTVPDLNLDAVRRKVAAARVLKVAGRVTKVIGLMIEVIGIVASIEDVCLIQVSENDGQPVLAEVVGFKENNYLLMPIGELGGIFPGCRVIPCGRPLSIRVGEHLLGRVLDGLGVPMDGGTTNEGEDYPVYAKPPNALQRRRIADVLVTRVRAVDALLTCGCGQRIGIFAGSGVGKSTLLGMIARYSNADVNVIGLIGERSREVLDFIENSLGRDGLARSVLVVATSDQPALVRLKGAFVASAIAEYFRDQGKNVLLMVDSITRFAMAQREVGLTVGEPPATKGYTPSVFTVLPRLLERSGTSRNGTITAFYTVLVEGDDMNEPIADAVRGILDGHIVLSRRLTSRNHYPAIDIPQSVSRVMPELVSKKHLELSGKIREMLSIYEQSEDLINIGAYAKGSNLKIDSAIEAHEKITDFLKQDPDETSTFEETLMRLESLFSRQ